MYNRRIISCTIHLLLWKNNIFGVFGEFIAWMKRCKVIHNVGYIHSLFGYKINTLQLVGVTLIYNYDIKTYVGYYCDKIVQKSSNLL